MQKPINTTYLMRLKDGRGLTHDAPNLKQEHIDAFNSGSVTDIYRFMIFEMESLKGVTVVVHRLIDPNLMTWDNFPDSEYTSIWSITT